MSNTSPWNPFTEESARQCLRLGKTEPNVVITNGMLDIQWPDDVRSDNVLLSTELFEEMVAAVAREKAVEARAGERNDWVFPFAPVERNVTPPQPVYQYQFVESIST